MAGIPISDCPPKPSPEYCPKHPDNAYGVHIVIPRANDDDDAKPYWHTRYSCEECQREDTKQKNIELHVRQSGVTPKYQDLTWDSFVTDLAELAKAKRPHKAADCKKMSQLKAWLMGWAEAWDEAKASGSSWVFSGAPGNGKTHLAATLGLEVIRQHLVRVQMVSLSDLFMSIKTTYGKGGRAEMDRMREIVQIPLLIIDEVGLQRDTDWEFEKLSYIIHERINHQKPSVYVTNVGQQKWRGSMGDRITDRLLDKSVFKVVPFSWPSFRTGQQY
jgi:DNA replication protein DnaC